MNKIFKLSVLPLALFVTQELQATKPGAYFGAGGGFSAVHDNEPGISQDNKAALGGRVFFGYNFNPYFGLETNYVASGKTKFSDDDYSELSGNYSFKALTFVGKAYLPFSNDQFNVYGLVGAAQIYNKFNVMYDGASLGSLSTKGMVPTAGIGANYYLNPHLSLGLELSGFGEKEAVDSIGILSSTLGTLSLAYQF